MIKYEVFCNLESRNWKRFAKNIKKTWVGTSSEAAKRFAGGICQEPEGGRAEIGYLTRFSLEKWVSEVNE